MSRERATLKIRASCASISRASRSGAHGMQGTPPRRWSSKTERVTINDATEEELDALWGVGPANARRILEYRREHGRIKGPDDLVAIEGIDGALAQLIAEQADFG
jgi:competence protein ComEA